ncbi:hypothetical protein [Enterococcus sp. CSURQ0835]|uniref:hypothetical protein n=1 Tax=Enterococcus sp. CSURQ0835 TaxID=2681394 RepID=UPI0013583466|nr:hypothetical protein [Enterococcus sp. CSURQ0835]
MFSLIPTNMAEVAQKLTWSRENGIDATEESVILNAVLENTQQMLNEALEGAYWSAQWDEEQQNLIVLDVLGKPLATITPWKTDFVTDFKQNTTELLRVIDTKVQQIVKKH